VTRRRLYLETMQRVLPTVGRKLLIDEDTTGVLPLLSLDGVAPRLAPANLAVAGGGQ
jgi:membrane protease subunit HflK